MPESSYSFDVPLTHAHVVPPQHNAFVEIKRLQCMTHFAEAGFSFFFFTFITAGLQKGGRAGRVCANVQPRKRTPGMMRRDRLLNLEKEALGRFAV